MKEWIAALVMAAFMIIPAAATSAYGGFGFINESDALKLLQYVQEDNTPAYRELLTSLLDKELAINFADPESVKVLSDDQNIVYVHRISDNKDYWVFSDYIKEP